MITVRGEATGRARPDHAEVSVRIETLETTAVEAERQLAADVEAVHAVLDDFGEAIRHRVPDRLSVYRREDYNSTTGTRDLRGYEGSSELAFDVTDLTAVGRLVAALVPVDSVFLDDVDWVVELDNRAHDDVRAAAVADARRRASAYATGLGLRVGPVAWVAEPGLRCGPGDQGQGVHRGIMRRGMADPAGAGGEPEVVAVQPPDTVEVSAEVEVEFAILAP